MRIFISFLFLRLYFASFVYVLMHGLRRLELAGATCSQGRVRNDSAEAAQDRRPHEGHRAQGLAVNVRGLAPCGNLRKGTEQPAYAPVLADTLGEKLNIANRSSINHRSEKLAPARPEKARKLPGKHLSGVVHHRMMLLKTTASRIKSSTTSSQAVPQPR